MWPVRSPLQEDEILCTWIARSAAAMGLHACELYSFVVGKYKGRVENVDCARNLCNLATLADAAGIDYARLAQATMLCYEGLIYESRIGIYSRHWIVTAGLTKGQIGGYPICPYCLASDRIPYYRTCWRLVCYPICLKHKCILTTVCDQCGAPILPWAYSANENISDFPYCICHECGADLRKQQSPRSAQDEWTILTRVLKQLEKSTILGVASGPHIYSLAFYHGWNIAMSLVSGNRWGARVQTLLSEDCDSLLPTNYDFAGSLGALQPSKRLEICVKSLFLLEDWPHRFIRICQAAGIHRGDLDAMRGGVPYWMYQTSSIALNTRYIPNNKEVAAAAAVLNSIDAHPTRHLLERLIGVTESIHVDSILKPTKMDFTSREARTFFNCFDREIAAASVARGHKYRLARDRTIVVAVCLGGGDLADVCGWTTDHPLIRQALPLIDKIPATDRPPPIELAEKGGIGIHLAWFLKAFPRNTTAAGVLVFAARSGVPPNVETVRITAGQVKHRAGLQRAGRCINALREKCIVW